MPGAPLTGGGAGIGFTYQYTAAGQLSGAASSLAGMIWSPMVGRTENYAVNSLNQYMSVTTDGAPAAPTYDDNGNLTGDGQGASYAFDAENRLTSATVGAQSIIYRSYANGARRSKDVGGTVTQYLVSADHVIAEYDGPGDLANATLLRRYVHGPGTDRPIAMVEGDAGSGYTHTYYHADRMGSVVALTDDAGAEIARYAYSAYGAPYLVDPGTGAQTQVAAGQPYLFTGRRFDFETGLYYYRARYYSASLGRFLQTDPIGYKDQMNLYAYVGNDPVNAWDPTGQECYLLLNNQSSFCQRRRTYLYHHSQYRSITNWFGAAAYVNNMLADSIYDPDIFFSNESVRLLMDLGDAVFDWAMQQVKALMNGQEIPGVTDATSVEEADRNMEHMEQTIVQQHLDQLKKDNPKGYERLIKESNRALNDPEYGVPKELKEKLGGKFDYANQEHREAYGLYLLERIREGAISP